MKLFKQIIWPLIMALYGMAILALMVTDELKSYIHPKLHLLIFIAMIILFILAGATLKENLKKNIVPSLKATYLVFLVPLLFFFVGSDADAARQVAIENGLKISAVSSSRDKASETEVSETSDLTEDKTEASDEHSDSQNALSSTVEDSDKTENETEETDATSTEGTLQLTDVNYTAIMEDLHVNLSDYKGRKISYLGLVYKQEDFDPTEIVVGRLLMYCCAADAQVMGLLGNSDQANEFRDGDWVTITAYVNEREYKDPYSDYVDMIPYLAIESIEAAEEPDDPYVYLSE